MSEHTDEQVWTGVERHLAGIERLIPMPRPWRAVDDRLTWAPVQLRAGRALGPTSPAARRPGPRLLWILIIVSVSLALVAGAIVSGVGGRATPTLVPSPSADHGFLQTGSMAVGRERHSATLLPDGRVLIAGGGVDPSNAISAELYDPLNGAFAPTGSMAPVLMEPSATLLRDGRVLFSGYRDATAELYDPATGTFKLTGFMSTRRWGDGAVLLPDGRVLAAGGKDGDPAGKILASAELYDPSTKSFIPTGSMVTPRLVPTATLLTDGRVLVVGGEGGNTSAELYDPTTGRFSLTGAPITPRDGHTAARLDDGRVLIAGGWDDTGPDRTPTPSAELYDPKARTFTPTGSMVVARVAARSILLPDGRVLITGGGVWQVTEPGASNATPSEVYDPRTGTFSLLGSATVIFRGSTSTLLADGDVLIAGGTDNSPTGSLPTAAYLFDYRLTSGH